MKDPSFLNSEFKPVPKALAVSKLEIEDQDGGGDPDGYIQEVHKLFFQSWERRPGAPKTPGRGAKAS